MLTTSERKPETSLPKYEPLEETAQRVLDGIGTRTGEPEIKSGIYPIDFYAQGLHRSHLCIIAARPSVGKTSLATQIMWEVSKKFKTAFVSLEMTKEAVLERTLIQSQEINGVELQIGKNKDIFMDKFSRWFTELGERRDNLKIFDSYCYTENQLYTLTEHLEYFPEILILDHLQCIRSDARHGMFEAIKSYLAYLNAISKEHNICSIVLSQINREGNTSPSLATLKGSGAIEEYADEVFILDRDVDEISNPEPKVDFMIAKNRYGRAGLVHPMYFRGEHTKFIDESSRAY